MTAAVACVFCARTLSLSIEHDELGHTFWCCGYCFAHVIHAVQPHDVRVLIAERNRWAQMAEYRGATDETLVFLLARSESQEKRIASLESLLRLGLPDDTKGELY